MEYEISTCSKSETTNSQKNILPLIIERMINPSDFYFLVLYEAVLEGNETNDDSKFSESEQIRAIRCVKKWLKKQ